MIAYRFIVEVVLEREAGKFASRDELGDQILEALEAADYGEWTGGNEGQYYTEDWTVTEEANK